MDNLIFPISVACESLTIIKDSLTEKGQDDLADKFGIALTAFDEILQILNGRRKEEAKPTTTYTLADIKAAATQLAANGKSDGVKAAIQMTGARKLSEIPVEKYEAFMAELYKCTQN